MKDGRIAVLNISIETESPLTKGEVEHLKGLIKHNTGHVLISVASESRKKRDKRQKQKPPFPCNICSHCSNSQCWFNDQFSGDFDGDVDVCYKSPTGNEKEVLKEYWERIERDMQ